MHYHIGPDATLLIKINRKKSLSEPPNHLNPNLLLIFRAINPAATGYRSEKQIRKGNKQTSLIQKLNMSQINSNNIIRRFKSTVFHSFLLHLVLIHKGLLWIIKILVPLSE